MNVQKWWFEILNMWYTKNKIHCKQLQVAVEVEIKIELIAQIQTVRYTNRPIYPYAPVSSYT